MTESKYQKQTEWNKANTTFIGLKLNNRTDADIIQKLQTVSNKMGYIKALIKADLEREKISKNFQKKLDI